MDTIIIETMDRVLSALSGKLTNFYLAGGTALSNFYFHHRQSYDLDFFTKDFSKKRIEEILAYLENSLKLSSELIRQQNKKDRAKMLIYYIKLNKRPVLKIDFVEDFTRLIKQPKLIDGILVLSIEDIYLRKVHAACGNSEIIDSVGRKIFKGGRQEAKDFFDLYYLSKTFMPLSKFAKTYCSPTENEAIIIWYRTFDRTSIKLGLNEIITDKQINYTDMERHFKQEVEKLIIEEL